MKKVQVVVACLGIIILMLTCQKLDFDVITKVQTTSVTTGVDYIQAKGEIVDLSADNHGEYGFCYSTGPLPTADDQKVVIESPKKGVFTCQITGLSPNSKYYIRPYCYDGGSSVYGDVVEVKTSIESLKDVDNNTYNAMSICNQVWMQENLKVTHYRNGDEIPNVTNDANWSGLSTGALCWYNNEVSNKEVYGALYNYFAIADPRNVCPVGWHVPSDTEWATLIDCLGGDDIAGGSMKEYGLSHWKKPNEGATNSSGFSALPAGYRGNDASFNSFGEEGKWWTATAIDATSSAFRYIYNSYTTVFKENFNKVSGLSIRCIKGELLSIPSVTTSAIGNISPNSASSGGNVVSDGGSTVSARGVCWSTSQNPTISLTTKTIDGTGVGEYTSNLSGLNPNTTYYVRAYATNSVGTAYGSEISFTTSQATSIPALTTTEASSVTSSSAVSGGNITFEGSSAITERGVCWSTSQSPTVDLTTKTVESISGTGSFAASITGLAANTKYYVRAYATNVAGTAYGNEISFTTIQEVLVPTLTTADATSITSTTAIGGGNITSMGSTPIVERGVCWSTLQSPTVDLTTKTVETTSLSGMFICNINGLTANTKYYVRAYATNSMGVGYGNEVSFTTLQYPTAVTDAATSITPTSATLNGTVNANGTNTTVTFEYGTSTSYGSVIDATPNIVTGSSNTSVSASINGLSENITYHFRVKAVSAAGTIYGDDVVFSTLCVVPTVSTNAATSLGGSYATLNGFVNASGFSTVVNFEYGTTTSYGGSIVASQSPLVGANNTAVSAVLSGLSSNTVYHYRVKAENCGGIIYGADNTFTTLQPPTASTSAATSVAYTTANLNGVVNANNTATAVVFNYGTTASYGLSVAASPSPVTGNSTTSVTVGITGLSSGTLYHYRVHASSDGGVADGSDMTFTTATPPVVSSMTANPVGTTVATLNCTINPNSQSTSVSFEYGLTTSYGSSVSGSPSPISGSSNTSVSASVSILSPGTTYHFRVVTVSLGVTFYSSDASFTTQCNVPAGTTNAATSVTNTTATFNGIVNANSFSTTVTFEYGLNTSYGSSVAATPGTVTGTSNTSVSKGVTGLTPNTTYHFRVKTVNCGGTIYGDDQPFTTLCTAPTATANAASALTISSATLNGTVNANNFSTSVTFEYGTTTSYGNSISASPGTVTGTSATAVSAGISGLTTNTLYHYRVKTVNCGGTIYSGDATFTTLCPSSLTANHTAGSVAPVTKSVTYGIVQTNLSGSNKCWITQNLGSSNQATSVTDATEPSAGWYWQFNRSQGYKHDGTNRTPSTAFASIDENSDWIAANDPCALLLGSGWRIPTYTEYYNVHYNNSWSTYDDAFNSVLKLHAAGQLVNGTLSNRGTSGYYYSSSQYSTTTAYMLFILSSSAFTSSSSTKSTYGRTIRCIKD